MDDGSLFLDEDHTQTFSQAPDFPDAFQPVAKYMVIALDNLRDRQDVEWVYLSPAADFQADGEKTGNYAFAGVEFTTNADGESYISYADFAQAMLDLVEEGDKKQ